MDRAGRRRGFRPSTVLGALRKRDLLPVGSRRLEVYVGPARRPGRSSASRRALRGAYMHQIRYNLEGIPDVAAIGLSVAGGHMFYASFELQMNIWMAERR